MTFDREDECQWVDQEHFDFAHSPYVPSDPPTTPAARHPEDRAEALTCPPPRWRAIAASRHPAKETISDAEFCAIRDGRGVIRAVHGLMRGKINYWRVATIVLLFMLAMAGYAIHVLDLEAEQRQGPEGSSRSDPWLRQMVDWYYPHKNTEQWEELFVRDFFRDRRSGFFVDVGASHFREASTTYFLDKHLGWKGFAIDAIPDYLEGYEKHRPRTMYFALYVGDKSNQDAKFYLIKNDPRKSTGNREAAQRHKERRGLGWETVTVPTITLNDLLERYDIEKIDFLSMDIELAEPAALAGFDIVKYQPQLVLIETHSEVKSDVFAYFDKHGYVNIEKYAKFDVRNSYFTPKATYEQVKHRPEAWEQEVDSSARARTESAPASRTRPAHPGSSERSTL